MSHTLEVRRESWGEYLGLIERLMHDRPVRIERVDQDVGDQVVAEHVPLRNIHLESKGAARGTIEVDLGRDGEVDHREIQPSHLFFKEGPAGELECLDIEDVQHNKTLIYFEHPMLLPERTRSTAGRARPEGKVREYMTQSPETIARGTSIAEADKAMRRLGVRHLPVVGGERPVGVVSDRDLYLVRANFGVNPADVSVDEIMTPFPYVVSPDTRLDEVAAVMARRKYGSAVVVDGGKVVGIFTTTDALRALVDFTVPGG